MRCRRGSAALQNRRIADILFARTASPAPCTPAPGSHSRQRPKRNRRHFPRGRKRRLWPTPPRFSRSPLPLARPAPRFLRFRPQILRFQPLRRTTPHSLPTFARTEPTRPLPHSPHALRRKRRLLPNTPTAILRPHRAHACFRSPWISKSRRTHPHRGQTQVRSRRICMRHSTHRPSAPHSTRHRHRPKERRYPAISPDKYPRRAFREVPPEPRAIR